MGLSILGVGVIVGVAFAIPVGPVNVLCARRALQAGPLHAIVLGSGAAAADALYALVAALGVSLVTEFVADHQAAIRVVGGLALLAWGARLVLARPAERAPVRDVTGWVGPSLAAFFITLTNPMTVLAFAAAATTVSVELGPGQSSSPPLFAAGVFAGSMTWWIVLGSIVGLLRRRIARLLPVDRISGWLLVGLGALVLVSLAR